MANNNYHVGDYTLKVTGDMDLSCEGSKTTIRSTGSESSMLIAAGKTVGVFSGSAFMVVENDEEEAGKAALKAGETGCVTLGAGPIVGGVTIKLQGPTLLEMSVGEPGVGSSIIMTPESITFKVAENTINLTGEGIVETVGEVTREVTVEGHNLTAGETEMNVGAQGFTMEGLTMETTIQTSVTSTELAGTYTTTATKNMTAALTMIG